MMEDTIKMEQKKAREQLGLKSFNLGAEGIQVILAHKQINDVEHIVFTQGEQPNAKLRCFKLSRVDEKNHYHAEEYLNAAQIADAARILGVDDKTETL